VTSDDEHATDKPDEHAKDKPPGSLTDETQPSGHDPEGATQSEERSGAGAGEAQWECLTCGTVYDEDHGTCPKDDAPLRKVGRHATPQAGKIAHSTENIERPAAGPGDTPEGYRGAKPGSKAEEPADGELQGESPAEPRPPGETSGLG